MTEFCPVHCFTNERCGSWCEAVRFRFRCGQVDLADYWREKYGRAEVVERVTGLVCPGCGGKTHGGRRRYHGTECRQLARKWGRVSA